MVTAMRARGIRGNKTEAYGADPSDLEKTYEFRYKIVSLNSVITSHDDALNPNPQYPNELQPRLRDRAASRVQVNRMAANLNPRVLLHDSGFLDTGPIIVGDDNVVESGNGRMIALRKAAQDFPDKYKLYSTMVAGIAKRYGIDPSRVSGIEQPVLVRERITPVDRVAFAAEANTGTIMSMSPFEQALQDAGRLSDNIINTVQIGEDQSIDQALRAKSNSYIVNHFISTVPMNERATISEAKGSINATGLQRLKLAIFAKTYTGDSGQRLTRIFSENIDPIIKSIENAMFQSLPDMAKAESLIGSDLREKELSVASDLAEVIDVYASLKQSNLKVRDYLAQSLLFEEKLGPLQKRILSHLDDISSSPKKVREFLRATAEGIVEAPAKGQTSMLGLGYNPPTKEELVNGIINKQRRESGKPALPTTPTAAKGKGLEKPDTGRIESTRGMGPEVGRGSPKIGTIVREVKPKPKVTVTKPRPGKPRVTILKADLASQHERRSAMSRQTDEAILASNVVLKGQYRLWRKRPNRYDIRGIDTPRSSLVSVKKGKVYHTRAPGGTLLSRKPIRGAKVRNRRRKR